MRLSDIVESYQFLEQAGRYLSEMRAKQSQPPKSLVTRSSVGGTSLSELLNVLVCNAIEYTDGKARAAFYLTDEALTGLYHVTGMTDAYARCVNGFAIGERSLACGLAVARQQPVVTPDVSEEPRWKPWLWLAEQFRYRACWSFPISISSGKVLGSFAVYYPERRDAASSDLDFASVLTRSRHDHCAAPQ
jgi:GAF domain-containing protein